LVILVLTLALDFALHLALILRRLCLILGGLILILRGLILILGGLILILGGLTLILTLRPSLGGRLQHECKDC
jgi:hypothetical protein